MTDCFILDHVRTPRGRGRSDGALHRMSPVDLAATVFRALRDRSGFDAAAIDDIVFGCVEVVGEQGGVIPRAALLLADYPQSVPAIQLSRFCASGLDAINIAAAEIMAGQADMIVAGGLESLSRVAMGTQAGAFWTDPRFAIHHHSIPQGIGADIIATQRGYSRADVDGFAARSHQRAARAWDAGHFDRSVIPVRDEFGTLLLDRDEHVRPATTVEGLAALKPSFAGMGEVFDPVALQRFPALERIEHVHHAGNSSGIVDGAAAMLLGSAATADRLGLARRARVRSFASVGSDPSIVLDGPPAACRKALARAGMTAADIDLVEVNEAFASVVLLVQEELGLDPDRVNVNGGAIAMGHPMGATGMMILGTVLDELERTGKSTALVTLCAGIGMATATVIERV